MESYTKFRIAPGAIEPFLAAVDALIDAGRSRGLSRLDCFVARARHEAVCMLAAPDAATIHAFEDGAMPRLIALGAHATSQTRVLGGSPPPGRPASVRGFAFDDGVDPEAPTAGAPVGDDRDPTRIEIATWFDIHPGATRPFRALAREMTDIVRRCDPGTARYDWFYADDGSAAIAMDTYRDHDAMRAHMRNCHDLHEALLDHAGMTTEFLGALPPEAAAAISRYAPYVLPFHNGLHA